MHEIFVPKTFSAEHSSVIDSAVSVIQDYQRQGYDLTLRQLYYQFIANDLFPDTWFVKLPGGQMTKNHERNYKKLGGILNDARLAGKIDWEAIVDRTRSLTEWAHEVNVKQALQNLHDNYALDMWTNQPARVEVWVEKEALVGVVRRVCAKYDMPFFACRGYTSASSSYVAYQRVIYRHGQGQRTIILHLGDHDPSGIDMTRDIIDRMVQMTRDDEIFEVRRLALNWDQIKKFNPPPSPAKITDSRAKDYIERFGDDSWELDALKPSSLANLVDKEVNSIVDWDLWEERGDEQAADKAKLQEFINQLEE